MARSPLFGFIRKSLRIAQASLHTDVPIDEILDGALTRRQFVIGSAAAIATLSCTSLPVRRDARVIIIGAGIAGLTAGYRLTNAGIDVRIFDGQNRTGGRMLSLRNFFPDGQVAELGGELIDTGHTNIRRLAGELGIELDDLSQDDPSVARDIWYFDGVSRSEREVVEAFRPVAARIEADLTRPEEVLDRMSIAQWLDDAGVSGWFREMLDVGFTTEFGLEIDQQSAMNLLTMIDTNPDPFRMYGESDERFHVRGGNDLITNALAKQLEDRIELSSMLQRIRRRANGLIECTFTRGSFAAEHVIVAIPFTMLRSVQIDIDLPERKRRAINELGYGTNAKLMIGFSERIWRTRHHSNGSTLTDLGYQLTWETSRRQPGNHGVLTNFTGGPLPLSAATVAGQLDVVYPGIAALRGKEARMLWPTNPFVRGSYSCYLPGQWTTIRGVEGEAVGNLHFAGEHCSADAQGFMEGGCETGERAAAEVLAALTGVQALSRTAGEGGAERRVRVRPASGRRNDRAA